MKINTQIKKAEKEKGKAESGSHAAQGTYNTLHS